MADRSRAAAPAGQARLLLRHASVRLGEGRWRHATDGKVMQSSSRGGWCTRRGQCAIVKRSKAGGRRLFGSLIDQIFKSWEGKEMMVGMAT